MMIVRIIPQHVNIQQARVIIRCHVKAADIVVIRENHSKQIIPGGGRVRFKGTAAGAGHIHADTHIFPTIIENRYALIGHHRAVAIPPPGTLFKRDTFQAKENDKGSRGVTF